MVLKGKKKACTFKLLKSVIVQGMKVVSSDNHIKIVLGRTLGDTKAYEGFLTIQSLNDSQGWLAQLISITNKTLIEAWDTIEKSDRSIAIRFLFIIINNTIMPSQNKSIPHNPKEACLGMITSRKSIDIGLFNKQEITIRLRGTRPAYHSKLRSFSRDGVLKFPKILL